MIAERLDRLLLLPFIADVEDDVPRAKEGGLASPSGHGAAPVEERQVSGVCGPR